MKKCNLGIGSIRIKAKELSLIDKFREKEKEYNIPKANLFTALKKKACFLQCQRVKEEQNYHSNFAFFLILLFGCTALIAKGTTYKEV